ncbi:MAG: HEAT repeat domain-containing protein, partial [Chloroflexota bacterium]|nr:HEAT repeat domain-containing protein [Chloroflexota bacterium]
DILKSSRDTFARMVAANTITGEDERAAARAKSARISAVHAIGQIGDPSAVDALATALTDGLYLLRDDEREEIVKALGLIGDARAIEPLLAQQEYGRWRIAEAATEALGRIGDVRTVESLIARVRLEAEEGVASEALRRIRDRRAVDPLLTALNDDDFLVRRVAAEALDNLGWQPTDANIDAAYRIAKGKWEETRLSLAWSSKIGDFSWPVVFSPDGKMLVTSPPINIRDTSNGAMFSKPKFSGNVMTFSPAGDIVAVAESRPVSYYENNHPNYVPAVKLADARTGDLLCEVPQLDQSLRDMLFSPDGTKLTVVSGDSGLGEGYRFSRYCLIIYDVASRTRIRELIGDDHLQLLGFGKDGKDIWYLRSESLGLGTPGEEIVSRRLSDWEISSRTSLPDGQHFAGWNPTAGFAVTVSEGQRAKITLLPVTNDKQIKRIRLDCPVELPWTVYEHPTHTPVAFSPNGHILSILGRKNNLLLWKTEPFCPIGKISVPIDPIETIAGPLDYFSHASITWSPDNERLAVVNQNQIFVYRVALNIGT